jgi:hypothetical protein
MVSFKEIFAISVSGQDNSPQNHAEQDAANDFLKEYVRKNGNPIPRKFPSWAKGCIPNVSYDSL